MPGTKTSALTAATALTAADQFPIAQSGASKSLTASVMRQYIGAGLSNASVSTVSAGFAAETYLAGSAITIPVAGAWKVGTLYSCIFDMTKTAAGTAALSINVRLGTTGGFADGVPVGLSFGAGTAAADTGLFEVLIIFRSVGGGTSAVIQAVVQCTHHLAATGLISSGASGVGIINATSAGFNSTTQTILGLSVVGGASFSGTNTLVQAFGLNI